MDRKSSSNSKKSTDDRKRSTDDRIILKSVIRSSMPENIWLLRQGSEVCNENRKLRCS
jgi:hypothetical protein